MRGTKAKKIREAVYGDLLPRMDRSKGSLGEKLRKQYQRAKKFNSPKQGE